VEFGARGITPFSSSLADPLCVMRLGGESICLLASCRKEKLDSPIKSANDEGERIRQ
jgi:hypothetical protein